MRITDTEIDEVKLLEPVLYGDERGFFMETWNARVFKELGLDISFVQDNHSSSSANILRGLHYQVERPQGKLVRVVRGEVFDVAVDVRRSSNTFGQWVGVILNETNKNMLWIPPGFAHGFYVMSDMAEFLYKCTDYYAPEHERTVIWNDPDIAIKWPLQSDKEPVLSEKDRKGLLLFESDLMD